MMTVTIKSIAATCLFGTALAALPVLAQSPNLLPSSPASPSAGASVQFLTQMSSDQWRGSKLVGLNVYGSDNQKIGDINEVILDRNGQAKAVVIGVGGFLGIGEKNVAVAFDKVQWNAGGDLSSAAGMAVNRAEPRRDATSSLDVPRTSSGTVGDPNAQPGQPMNTGGAALSNPPSSSSLATGAASTSATGSSATRGERAGSASKQDYPDCAFVLMSKQELQNAPEFHYASDRIGSGASGTNR